MQADCKLKPPCKPPVSSKSPNLSTRNRKLLNSFTMASQHSKTKRLEKSQTPPPSYSVQDKVVSKSETAKISASDIPHWRWTNAQCREWLEEVLFYYCGKSRRGALQRAVQFDGFGPNLYLIKLNRWYE
jgi:hypothetical protein